MELKVGDIIVNPAVGNRRQITRVRKTGYQWKYADFGDRCPNGQSNSFMSENSNDEFFDRGGWVKELSPLYDILFPQLINKSWKAEVMLDRLAASLFPACNYKASPLNDPYHCRQWIEALHTVWQVDYSFGGYLEDRSNLWRGHYHEPGEMIHLGVDYNVPTGTSVHSACDGRVVTKRCDPDQNGGWGGLMIVEMDSGQFVMYGHLDPGGMLAKRRVRIGDKIGEVGDIANNGGWYPHLHLQCVSAELAESINTIDGYTGPRQSGRLAELYPNPIQILGQ